ncbi:AGE family epimerase/isomerase [Ideonella sp.]|jgi:mannose/cellobiose epimerase-like protein (N-acyl-D-glucosamine 2-epimerase family)|uniref:AGE family epimerase/isomerase n=1 Tax=Ideonella sp. TaxID=1929293 RepID=UPI0037BE8FA3
MTLPHLPPLPNVRDPAVLRQHVWDTLTFYDGRCVDESGGLFQFFKDDGTVYDRHTRHLVSSTRYVLTFAQAARRYPQHPRASAWLETARHALRFVQQAHWRPETGGYAWLLRWQDGRAEVLDATHHCYGLAFVLLAHAHALQAGITEARDGLAATFALMEQRFWEPDQGLYADEATPNWQVQPYRGQNANMHACEAMLAAYEATGEAPYLERAYTLAESVTVRLAAHAQGGIWEHYRREAGGPWQPDWDYNRHDKTNIFRPWGFQTGHFTEWTKLLLNLERDLRAAGDARGQAPWLLHRAQGLFDAAWTHGWDAEHGGLVYGFAPQGSPATDTAQHVCDGDKYHWVQAESLAAAAVLATRTGEARYWQAYEQLWAYVWTHFVDHQHGAWFRILGPANQKLTNEKSPAGKVDYHNMGACHEVMDALRQQA